MCREEKSEQVRNFGADHIIDYRSESIRQEIKSITPSGVDIVFDVVGGDGAIDLVKRLVIFTYCLPNKFNLTGLHITAIK